jgi:hypothetical protein
VGWRALLDCADEHQLLPALWAALRSRGVAPLPQGLRDTADAPLAILERAYQENAARVRDLHDQTRSVLRTLNDTTVDALPIKGAHWLMVGLVPDPVTRVMVDVDVLVPPGQVPAAMSALHARSYEPAPVPDDAEPSDHQVTPLTLPGRCGSVELHVEPMVRHWRHLLTGDELRADAVDVAADGACIQIPSATHAMVLLIGHAQLQDETARLLRLPLRALYDVSVVAPMLAPMIDWDRLHDHFRRAHALWALAGFAVAADELFHVDLPLPTRGGHAWLQATTWAVDRPALAHTYREVVSIPRALDRERMGRLYGADEGLRLAIARTRHVVRGVARRLTGPATERAPRPGG